uniref:Protein kinase domain-containing protein n=1 Tax=Romanomermis culicivorax TaxID=13658 RepID=A0A915L8P5_ROMCU
MLKLGVAPFARNYCRHTDHVKAGQLQGSQNNEYFLTDDYNVKRLVRIGEIKQSFACAMGYWRQRPMELEQVHSSNIEPILKQLATSQFRGDSTTYTFDGQRTFATFDGLVKFHFVTKVGLGEKREHLLLKPIRAPKYKYDESDVKILKKVGAGSFGEVFKVVLKAEKIFLAMKVLKDSVTDEDRANFLKTTAIDFLIYHKVPFAKISTAASILNRWSIGQRKNESAYYCCMKKTFSSTTGQGTNR